MIALATKGRKAIRKKADNVIEREPSDLSVFFGTNYSPLTG